MELYNSKILILLIEQFNKRKKDYLTLLNRLIFKDQVNMYTNSDNSNNSRSIYDGNVDNELCDVIRAIYDNDYSVNVTNSNTISNDITIDDMIKIIQDSNYKTTNDSNNNDKLVDLQIQLAMLLRIINMIKKSNTKSITSYLLIFIIFIITQVEALMQF